jgi:serine protease Do
VIALIASGAVGARVLDPRVPPAQSSGMIPAPAVTQPKPRNESLPSFANEVDRVKPAVVAVRARVDAAGSEADSLASNDLDQLPPEFRELFRRFGQNGAPQPPQGSMQALGSGFFISADGLVVTNNHVVEHATRVQVTTDDGRTLDAKVVGTDAKTDLALLKVTESGSYPSARLATIAPRVGDWVMAIGNPFGLGGTVTAGIVSAHGRDIGESQYDDFLQIDAPVNKGNSGGPTFNLDGEVVGVNTAIYSPSGGSVGVAFAIPSEVVRSTVAQLEKNGKVTRGYLGVHIQSLTKDLAGSLGLESDKGALVDEAQDGTPAAKAGLASGDVITAINGEAIGNARELSRKIAGLKPGSRVELTYWRHGHTTIANVELGALPGDEESAPKTESRADPGPQLGLRLAPAQSVPGAGRDGVVVTDVDPSSAAADKGISSGDVILEVNGRPVSQPADVIAGLAAARKEGKPAALLRIKSQDATRFVAIAPPNAG